MDKFIRHTGIGAPLRRSAVDTDQIIPASYLKRITRTGFEDGLFASWRSEPDFVLNKEPWSTGSILIVGPDFGIGASRGPAAGGGGVGRGRTAQTSKLTGGRQQQTPQHGSVVGDVGDPG